MTDTVPELLDTLVREVMEEWQIPGLALAITREGEDSLTLCFRHV